MIDQTLDAALYSTVWAATALFVTGELLKARSLDSGSVIGWPWAIWTTGAVLLAAHIALAYHVRHGWSHASVVQAVGEQTRSVYGVSWEGAVWVNFCFLALWLAEAAWWRAAPRGYLARSWLVTALTRGFYALILINAVIVFTAPSRRPQGIILMAVLCWVWRDTLRGAGAVRAARAIGKI